MESKKMMNEELLDAAACDAIGSLTPEESAAYQHGLAGAGAAGRSVDRQLRQTVATLAAASPHMKASDDLRARILQATAPKSFRLEDYRKASREDGRYYKWGFYAAAMFLVLGAMYNINARSQLTSTQNQLTKAADVVQQANTEILNLRQQGMALESQYKQQNIAMNVLLNGDQQLVCVDDKGQAFGRAIIDTKHHRAITVFSQEMIAPGMQPQLTLDVNGQKVKFETVSLTAPAKDLGYANIANNTRMPETFELQNLVPDKASQPRAAGMIPQ